MQRARDLMERLLRVASPLGLYAEEFDPETRRHLWNFPQAFSHRALIEAAARMIVPHARAFPTIFVPDMIIIRMGAGGGTLQQGLLRLCEAGVDRDGPRAQHRRPCSRGRPDGRRAMIAPSGEQIEIAVEDQQAVVVEV